MECYNTFGSMGFLEAILGLYGAATGTISFLTDTKAFLRDRVELHDLLARITNEKFGQFLPRLEHLCPDGPPAFDRASFAKQLAVTEFSLKNKSELPSQLLPILADNVTTPGATCPPEELRPIYTSIIKSSMTAMWNELSRYEGLANQLIIGGVDSVIADVAVLSQDVNSLSSQIQKMHSNIALYVKAMDPPSREQALLDIASFAKYAKEVWEYIFEELSHTAPPRAQQIGPTTYENPFTLVRSEDFNHNYQRLAQYFEKSPDWNVIERRTDNVFVEGGRGTGKSMFLRRLTAQATLESLRLTHPQATFDEVQVDYFGVYIKLARGYYEQFQIIEQQSQEVASLLAQHELNIEILDAFADTLRWLIRKSGLGLSVPQQMNLATALSSLLPNGAPAESLDGIPKLIQAEQNQILGYAKDIAFQGRGEYRGSAQDTVEFVRRLSRIFREHIFPDKEVRLFLLIDEFESLLPAQQRAINTIMKCRFPDITLKVGVRTDGRKTEETATPGEPIQTPRDYIKSNLDYDIQDTAYANLLHGIANRRLQAAGYSNRLLDEYLVSPALEIDPQELESELDILWRSGKRRNDFPNDEFREKYAMTAIYRARHRRNRRKSFAGSTQYITLSSGIVSNFIELCEYAFYFALSEEIPLNTSPAIPVHLQTNAAYAVSARLFNMIDGNVPQVGSILKRLVADLGSLLRSRLLYHSSEPEANRIDIANYERINEACFAELREVLKQGVVWSIFHVQDVGEAFKPRNTQTLPPYELIINRIYAPRLGFSPRARWRVTVTLEDLSDLINPLKREQVFARLSKSLMPTSASDGRLELV